MIMGFLTGVVAPTSSIVASTSNSTNAAKASTSANPNPANVANSQPVTQASVLSLSNNGKSRAASHGNSKSVDASFEKQDLEAKSAEKKDEKDKQEQQQSVNVVA